MPNRPHLTFGAGLRLLALAVLLAVLRPAPVLVTFGPPQAAVSYTHLRAHETVLDLVCRLLLEKKKPLNPL